MPTKKLYLAFSEEDWKEMKARKGAKTWEKLFFDSVMRLPICDDAKA